MSKILISSGPTRQFIDPVRYITNASSGEMGRCLAIAALELGHEIVIVSGPVTIEYPPGAMVVPVVTTEQMLQACTEQFQQCQGMIGAAAPCDYRPVKVSDQKIKKTGQPIELHLVETPDVVATLGKNKRPDQWIVGFALETEDAHFRAVTKLHKKCCDLVVINGPQAMNSPTNSIDLIDPDGNVVASCTGTKRNVSTVIVQEIQSRLIDATMPT